MRRGEVIKCHTADASLARHVKKVNKSASMAKEKCAHRTIYSLNNIERSMIRTALADTSRGPTTLRSAQMRLIVRLCILHLNRTSNELWIVILFLLAQPAVNFLLALRPPKDVAETPGYLRRGSGFRPVDAGVLRGLGWACVGAVWCFAVVCVGVPVA